MQIKEKVQMWKKKSFNHGTIWVNELKYDNTIRRFIAIKTSPSNLFLLK